MARICINAGAPDPFDVHVGARIRQRRAMLGLTQRALADRLGLSIEAVQQYENGEDRVGAPNLWRFAKALHVEITYFFEELS